MSGFFIVAGVFFVAALVAYVAESLDRRDRRRRRDHERREAVGRYATGCPAGITRTDVEKAVEDRSRARVAPMVAIANAVFATIRPLGEIERRFSEGIVEAARKLNEEGSVRNG